MFCLKFVSHFHTSGTREFNPSTPCRQTSSRIHFFVTLCFSNATAPKNKSFFLHIGNVQKLHMDKSQKFSTRRQLIQHFPVMQNHNIPLDCLCDQWETFCCCSSISWRTVCKRQLWHALSGDTVWWQDQASGPYTPGLWAVSATAGPDHQYPAKADTNKRLIWEEFGF